MMAAPMACCTADGCTPAPCAEAAPPAAAPVSGHGEVADGGHVLPLALAGVARIYEVNEREM